MADPQDREPGQAAPPMCRLTRAMPCPGRREAVYRVEWTMAYDPDPADCVSTLCAECYEGRPSIIRVLLVTPVSPTDRCSA